ncbi:hypothetical protein TWF281_006075 [Arthrobotrys megalospora]
MSKYQAKSSLEELPLDVKIDIIESLDSIYDLEALGLTCTVFRQICRSPLCDTTSTLYRRLLVQGEHGTLLRALAVLRAHGRYNQLQSPGHADEFPGNSTGDITEYVDKLLSYRKTASWFTNRFFEAMADKYGTIPPNSPSQNPVSGSPKVFTPSRAEKERVNTAFLLLWIFAEMTYIYVKTNGKADPPINFDNFNVSVDSDNLLFADRSPNPFGYAIMRSLLSYSGVTGRVGLYMVADAAVMYSVALYLSDLTTPMILCHAKTRSRRGMVETRDRLGCAGIYNRKAISNLIFWDLGLDGFRTFLEADEGTQDSVVGTYYGYLRSSKLDNLRGQVKFQMFTCGFFCIIDAIWDFMKKNSKNVGTIYIRPLWKKPGLNHSLSAPPWDQADEFDIDAVFCDNERLEGLGYFPPSASAHDKGFTRIAFADKMLMEICQCKENVRFWN